MTSPGTQGNSTSGARGSVVIGMAVPGLAPHLQGRLFELREDVHAVLHQEFQATMEDLEQLRGLLADAAEKLSGAFCEMTSGSEALLETLDGMPAEGSREPLQRVAELAHRISSKTGTTIQSLQFEDVASQLLAHVRRRLATLETFSKDMAVLHPDPEGSTVPLTEEALDRLFLLLEQHRADLAAASRKSVRQQSLEPGVVELF